jgi:hypothetical protein
MDPISCCAGATGLVDLGENLIAEIDRMIDSGGKINPQEQRALGASMTAAGFSPAQRGDILAAVADFNRDGRGISGSEHKILSRLVEGVAASNALQGAAAETALDPGVQRMSRQLEVVTARVGQDGHITPAESREVRTATQGFLDAVKAAQSGGGADPMQKMMQDGLEATMKKRHGGHGGGDEGSVAPGGGGGSGGGVSIGQIARVLGEVLNEQFKQLLDAANALGSSPSAQQTAQLQALSAQVNANAGALTNAQKSAEEALKAVARA